MSQRTDTKALKRAAQMPALHHRLADGGFDEAQSEVLDWLCSQPETRDALFQLCKFKGAIIYDRSTGKWRGKDVTA